MYKWRWHLHHHTLHTSMQMTTNDKQGTQDADASRVPGIILYHPAYNSPHHLNDDRWGSMERFRHMGLEMCASPAPSVRFLLLLFYILYLMIFSLLDYMYEQNSNEQMATSTIIHCIPTPRWRTNRGLETHLRLESLVLFFTISHPTASTTSTMMGGARWRGSTYGAGGLQPPQYVSLYYFFLMLY